MKNKFIKTILLSALFIVTSFFVWKNLPISIQNFSETSYGNKLVENLKKYKLSNSKLPNNSEWKTLEKLDFEMTELATNPEYKKIDKNNFKLIFVKGFDGPYLTYNSFTKEWTIE